MRIAAIALLGFFAAFTGAQAQSPAPDMGTMVMDSVLTEMEKRVIRDYFGQPKANDPKGVYGWSGYDPHGARTSVTDDEEPKAKKDKDKDKGKGKKMPPGLAKRDGLPPGLEKQLQRNGTLPPGLAKRDLPADLASRLPPRPDNQEIKQVEDSVVLIERGTGVILDVLENVIRGTANP